MVQTGTPQSVIISGESGAGKTESIKLILKYLARLSEITSNASKTVQDQILSANPVLEAFGNAKTSRNNNSSRFGKLITVHFSGGVINQASIISYLLEKSRVVHQQAGERNYHVFYQLLAACTADIKFGVDNGLKQSVDEYHYLSDPEASYFYNMDESESFNDVKKSMTILGINKGQQTRIFQVVGCVLRLGNVYFDAAETTDERALIGDVPELERICDTLGLNQSEVKRLFVSRNFGVRSIVTCFFSVQQVGHVLVIVRVWGAMYYYLQMQDFMLLSLMNFLLHDVGERNQGCFFESSLFLPLQLADKNC
jgi:myosin heavy subunit